jgi:hypothetical protein
VFITIFPEVGSSRQPTLGKTTETFVPNDRDLSSAKLTDKSKGVHHLVKDDENFPSPPDDKPLVIEDSNVLSSITLNNYYYLPMSKTLAPRSLTWWSERLMLSSTDIFGAN